MPFNTASEDVAAVLHSKGPDPAPMGLKSPSPSHANKEGP